MRVGLHFYSSTSSYYETREIYALTPFRHASLEFRVFTHPGARHARCAPETNLEGHIKPHFLIASSYMRSAA
eukprot:COSAG05_NODE_14130_length_407_cov_0.496753_1_plen_71_part_10